MSEQIIEIIEEITQEHVTLVLIEIEKRGGHHGHRHPHLVTVTVDGEAKQVHPGRYIVSVFKKAAGVDPSYELEEMQGGKLVPLADDAHLQIRGCESFISHVRGGASS
jgi:hypothetical protein